MRILDFISSSPQLYIFRESSNKTVFGGALYLIYIIILILLAVIYLIDYFSNDKYEFDYTLVKETFLSKKMSKNEEMNSKLETDLDFIFDLGKDGPDRIENNINNRTNFLLIDVNLLNKKAMNKEIPRDDDDFITLNSSDIINDDECIIPKGKIQTKNTGDFTLAVFYRCNKTDCSIRDEDKIIEDSYYLYMRFKGYSMNHQDPEKPIKPLPENYFRIERIQFLENTNAVFLNWELTVYEEKKGVFGKTYDRMVGNSNYYYVGDYKSYTTYTDDGHVRILPDYAWQVKDLDGNHFITLLYLESRPNYNQYEKYSRKKISFLDALANVAALSSTILSLMSLVYKSLYSNNYNNYKILENILTKKMKINLYNNNNNSLKEDEKGKQIELKTDLIDNKTEENENFVISINEDIDDEEKENDTKKRNKENLDLPLPKFLDFLVHKFYFKCCRPSSKQALIESCNNILSKYISAENIIYNLMKLEYLWKDYKWNNPNNEINQKDDLILNLKEK